MEQQQQQEISESPVQLLPDEMLEDVLRRLAPRGLAVSRCVCKAWHAAIDAHKLLRPELLPRSLGGIFVDFNMLVRPEFLSSSSSSSCSISGDLSYTERPRYPVVDHCNGLLLRAGDVVVNPATRQRASLPPRPPPHMSKAEGFFVAPYLVFDPAVSPHYEVLLMPFFSPRRHALDDAMAGSEWPPSSCETHVFSSRTGSWEERSLVREGEPAGTVATMKRAFVTEKHYSVYWRGALYVHSHKDFIWRVSVADGKYQVIKPPAENGGDDPDAPYLGRSEKGVYFAALDRRFRRLRVWILDDDGSSGQMEWVLKHQISNLQQVLASQDSYHHQQDDGACSWSFKDINHYAEYPEDDGDEEEEEPVLADHSYVTLLGLDPFKEIVYLNSNLSSGLAYDLNTCKVQHLGNMCPKYYAYN